MIRSSLFVTLLATGCAAPDASELFNALDVAITDAEGGERRFVDAVSTARRSLHVALPDAEDEALLTAIGEAWDAGIEVELVVDVDDEMDAPLQPLFDLGVPITLATSDVTYFDFALNDGSGRPVSWTSEEAIQSHAYVVVDRTRIVTGTTAGHRREGDRVVFEMRGEELVEDWLIEHNQLFGGIDATSLTAFSSPAKSIADFRWRYGTGTSTDLEVWFGPQERVTKRVVDAVYSARSRIWVMTDELANEGLYAALRSKDEWGFDVRVLTGPSLGVTSSALLREFDEELADVDTRGLTDVDEVPTVVLVDPLVANNGFATASKVMVLTHDLYSSARLYRDDEIANDQLVDGVLLVLDNRTADDRADIDRFVTLFEDRFEMGVPR